ncbi:hypothetical protein BCR33DRAFT_664309 [Rhizoclosmatium globosum]|uniref:NEDD8-activating enzyme E1 regulatory subunit n=1 Tax=Rhizoclosmatium globosum TaxID=329046 RepID=A0A1Y2BN53_9FUNG|nr:NEDD8-activating enzyme E1 regulatory subunit [Rhizoclosmatium sp. JEL0117]ORY36173.1 hypothetical protein BCR33DRAFT_664309 [Rhizoclosmatium globosum]|eukprot:ORY36173.1 hypothetical protein BCR33DRAFT_664309 [Rhizoclosmatium globosum]
MTAGTNGPSREQKYDRQLRLWQAHGQKALENTSILVVHANATATETLKNLVLPGIGSFTLVDGKVVDGADAGSNFFLEGSDIGRSRAQAAAALLAELNPDVRARAVVADVEKALTVSPELVTQHNIVVASSLPQHILLPLAKLCAAENIPLIVVRAYGFVGHLRIQAVEHCIVESHPDTINDLRLDCPFPELLAYANSFDFHALDNMTYAHIPYVVILLRCLEEWKSKNNGALPTTSPEKTAFRQMVTSLKREGVEDENFEEALKGVFRALQPTKIDSKVASILEEARTKPITAETNNFWILAKAVAEFVDSENGKLPLAGVVPDMKSDTESFVKLQTIFRDKAHKDVAKVHAIASNLSVGATGPSLEETARFCKNARNLVLIRTSTIESEYAEPYAGTMADMPENNVQYYLALRGVDAFYEEHKRYPGYHAEEVESDIGLLKKSCTAVVTKMGLKNVAVSDDIIHEMVRAGASELHTMASFMGGVCSQEAIKLITGQYTVLNNTFVYDGMRSVGAAHTF